MSIVQAGEGTVWDAQKIIKDVLIDLPEWQAWATQEGFDKQVYLNENRELLEEQGVYISKILTMPFVLIWLSQFEIGIHTDKCEEWFELMMLVQDNADQRADHSESLRLFSANLYSTVKALADKLRSGDVESPNIDRIRMVSPPSRTSFMKNDINSDVWGSTFSLTTPGISGG